MRTKYRQPSSQYVFGYQKFILMPEDYKPTKSGTPILASGIVQQDSSIMDLIGEHGNVATIPIYKPIDANESGMTDEAKSESLVSIAALIILSAASRFFSASTGLPSFNAIIPEASRQQP